MAVKEEIPRITSRFFRTSRAHAGLRVHPRHRKDHRFASFIGLVYSENSIGNKATHKKSPKPTTHLRRTQRFRERLRGAACARREGQ